MFICLFTQLHCLYVSLLGCCDFYTDLLACLLVDLLVKKKKKKKKKKEGEIEEERREGCASKRRNEA